MRKGLVVMAGIGFGGMAILALLAGHYLDVNPTIRALVDLRTVARDVYGDRLVELTWAPSPAPPPGKSGHGLRAVFRPEYGPNARTREQQAYGLGDWLLTQWGPGSRDVPRLAFVDVKGITDGELAWTRVTRDDGPGIAPPGESRYPPRPPAPAVNPEPGATPR